MPFRQLSVGDVQVGEAVPQEAADLGACHLAQDGGRQLAALEGPQPGRELGLGGAHVRGGIVVERHADAEIFDCLPGKHWRQGCPLSGAEVGDEHRGLVGAVRAEARFGGAVV